MKYLSNKKTKVDSKKWLSVVLHKINLTGENSLRLLSQFAGYSASKFPLSVSVEAQL